MNRLIRVLLLLVTAGLAGMTTAQAQTLTFNELPAPDATIMSSVVCGDVSGFRFASAHMHTLDGTILTDFTWNGTTHIGYESGRGFPITMTRVNGGTFSLQSLDLAEFYAPARLDHPDAEFVRVTGTQAGGATITADLTLDGVRDGPNGVYDFQHFVLPGTFVNLTSVVFTGVVSGGGEGGVAIDNIAYTLGSAGVVSACVANPAATVGPTITLTSPVPGNVVGTIQLAATASSPAGMGSVQFRVDGVAVGAADATAPYAVSFDTTTVPDGQHTISADAVDLANAVTTTSVVVTVRNTPVVSTDPHYLQFDGIDDYVQAPDSPTLSFGNGTTDTPLTIEAWFQASAMTRSQIIGKWGESANQEYRLQIVSGGSFRFDLRDTSAGASAYAFTASGYPGFAGSWHHIAVTYDGRGGATAADGITIYLDGLAVPVVRVNNAAYVAMENGTDPVQIGREGPSWNQFVGGLDDIRVWNYARAANQIQGLMTSELTGTEVGLMAYWKFNEGVGLLANDATAGAHTGTLVNGPVWVAGGPFGPPAPDTVPPVVSGVTVNSLTSTSAVIAFTTNEQTTASVSYSATGACPCTTVNSGVTGTSHNVALTGLAAATQYTFFVRATDLATNVTTTGNFLFTTLAANVDTTPPTVAMTAPTGGTVLGTITLTATASDASGIASVQFRVDGVAIGAADTVAPYSVSWDTTTIADGTHTITAEARDNATNLGTASVVVAVQNTPVSNTPHYISFDGVDDYLQVPDQTSLSFGNSTTDSPMTLEMWIQPTLMSRSQLFGKWGDSGAAEYRLQIASGSSFRFDLRDASTGAVASVFTVNGYASFAGAWHHVAVTYDGRGGATAADGITMYLDGVSVPLIRANNAAYVAMENGADSVQIGREGPAWFQYQGGMDDIRLWGVVRTGPQILGTMTTELTGSETNLRNYWKLNEGAGITASNAVSGGAAATLGNNPVWVAGGPMGTSGPDTTPPVISNIASSNVTSSGFTVTFTTNETTTAWVSYTTTGACPCTDVLSPTTGTSHTVTLTGLAANTLYTYFVRATDLSSNQTSSAAQTRQTAVTPPVLPVVSITGPSGTVLGTVTITATATSSLGIANVQFQIDGVNLGSPDVSSPYSATWNTTLVADGPHTITARATDNSANVGTASVSVTVQNTPVTYTPHYIDLDGVDDYVEVADANALSFGNGTTDTPLTLEMWIRPDVMGRNQLVGKWGESSNQEYRLQIVSGASFRFDIRDQSANATVSVFSANGYPNFAGGWHHVAVTYDGRGGATAADGIVLYLDGVSVPLVRANNPAYVAMENGTDPVQIGREGPAWHQYDGGLDELRMWNVARTLSQIQAALTTELTGSEAGLVGYWRFNEISGTTTANFAPGGQAGTLFNSPVFVAGGPIGSSGPDLTAPVISNVVASAVTASGFTVTFQTNEVATGWVSYSSTGACPCTDVFSAAAGTSHTVVLSGLAADTLYTYFVRASDASSNQSTTTALTQRTSLPPPPAPTVSITGPVGTVLGTVTISASVTSSIAVNNVQFRVDGVNVGSPDTLAPYSVAWNTTLVADGSHTISAIATDANGNTGSAQTTVIVQNTPIVTTPHYVTLDGIDDYITVPDANALSFGNGTTDTPFTFEMWLRPNDMGRHQLIGKWGESSNQEYKLQVASGSIRLDLRDQSANATVSVFTQNTYRSIIGSWHHLAVSYDGRGGATAADGVQIYLDGLPLAVYRVNNAAYVAMENLADVVQIGREGPQWFQYTGAMDDIRIWNVARSQAQIQAGMPVELTGLESGLVSNFKMNEASGTSAANSVATGQPATLFNGAAFVAGAPTVP